MNSEFWITTLIILILGAPFIWVLFLVVMITVKKSRDCQPSKKKHAESMPLILPGLWRKSFIFVIILLVVFGALSRLYSLRNDSPNAITLEFPAILNSFSINDAGRGSEIMRHRQALGERMTLDELRIYAEGRQGIPDIHTVEISRLHNHLRQIELHRVTCLERIVKNSTQLIDLYKARDIKNTSQGTDDSKIIELEKRQDALYSSLGLLDKRIDEARKEIAALQPRSKGGDELSNK